MQKSADFVGRSNRPILSSNIEHVLFSTIKSANFLDVGHYGDCLQRRMNIYFGNLFYLLLYYTYLLVLVG